jgi:hypothetical protein
MQQGGLVPSPLWQLPSRLCDVLPLHWLPWVPNIVEPIDCARGLVKPVSQLVRCAYPAGRSRSCPSRLHYLHSGVESKENAEPAKMKCEINVRPFIIESSEIETTKCIGKGAFGMVSARDCCLLHFSPVHRGAAILDLAGAS